MSTMSTSKTLRFLVIGLLVSLWLSASVVTASAQHVKPTRVTDGASYSMTPGCDLRAPSALFTARPISFCFGAGPIDPPGIWPQPPKK